MAPDPPNDEFSLLPKTVIEKALSFHDSLQRLRIEQLVRTEHLDSRPFGCLLSLSHFVNIFSGGFQNGPILAVS